MNILPLVERELREAARQKTLYWVRFLVALAGVALGTYFFLVTQGEFSKSVGRILVTSMNCLAFVFCVFSGMILTADSITQEKQDGTLGLLLLTDLRSFEIVLGKLAAAAINGVSGILVLMPILAVTLLMGGVTMGEVLRGVLALLVILLCSLCTGLFASAICRFSRRAAMLAFVLPLLAVVAPLFGGIMTNSRNPFLNFVFSPTCLLLSSMPGAYVSHPGTFWISIGIHLFTSFMFFSLTNVHLQNRVWLEPLIEDSPIIQSEDLFERQEAAAWRQKLRADLLPINPWLWLVSRDRRKMRFLWGVLILLAGVWLWGCAVDPHYWFSSGTLITTAVISGGFLKMAVVTEAAQQLGSDRRSGALELLLTTPLTEARIMAGQRAAIKRLLLVPALLFGAVTIGFAGHDVETNHADSAKWAAFFVVLAADIITIYWLGMWWGLSMKKAHLAVISVMLVILAAPWVIFWALYQALRVLPIAIPLDDETLYPWVLIAWICISLILDVLFYRFAKSKLLQYFRILAGTPTGKLTLH